MYDLGDRLLMVASDRISAYDVVLPTAIPDKGKVLTGLSVFWFEQHRGDRAQPLLSTDVPDEVRGPRAGRAEARDLSRRVRRARATCPAPAGRSTGSAARSAASSCRPGCASPTACRSRSSRPRRRPSSASTTRTSTSTGPPRSSATAALMEELRRLSLEVYARAAEHAERNGIILADTKFEFGRDRRRRDRARRRGPDARTPPASGRATPTSPAASQPSFDKQYVRDWLDQSGLGPLARRAPSCPPRSSQNTRAKYVEAYERIAGEPFDALASNALEGPRPDQAQGGHPRSAGPGGRARAAGARLRGRLATSTSAGWSSSTSTATATSTARVERDVRAAAREPADRELRGAAASAESR